MRVGGEYIMTDPIQKPGGLDPLKKQQQQSKPLRSPETQGKSFKEIQKEKEESKIWWGGFFSPKELKQFKENLLRFLSTQMKAEQRQIKKAARRLKRSVKGE